MRRLLLLIFVGFFAVMPVAGAVAQASLAATPEASPVARQDEEISFQSGPDTLYGSLRVPEEVTDSAPAVLIISGSGPTDRDGDSAGLPLGTNRHFADDLESLGVVSFRYDKFGSGKTGLASHPDGSGVDYELFLQEAWDAFDVLAGRPEVDPGQIIVLGHSEGALFALDMATDESREVRPAWLVLAAPLSVRYLDLLREQLGDAYAEAVEAGQMPQDKADELLAEIDAAIGEIRDTGKLTMELSDPSVVPLLSPINVTFFYQADQRDPAVLAGELPPDMPVLIIHGAKDEQVTTEQVDSLEEAFVDAGHTGMMRLELPNANHIFQVIEGEPSALEDYTDTSLPFSPEIEKALQEFMQLFLAE